MDDLSKSSVPEFDEYDLFPDDRPIMLKIQNALRKAVICETPLGCFGQTICYDLRFPHLYRKLSQAGAKILLVPAAFTKKTGEAHWHVLNRARAIENGVHWNLFNVGRWCRFNSHLW